MGENFRFRIAARSWLLCAVSLLAASACAAAPLYPFQALVPLPMPDGEISLRIGASYAHGGHLLFQKEDRDRKVAELPSIRAAVEVGPNSEIHFAYPLLYIDQEGQGSEYGSGDAVISGLFTPRYLNFEELPLGLKLAVKLPNADDEKEFGTDETDFFIGLAAARESGKFLTVVNADFAILGEPHSTKTEQDDVLVYSAAGVYDFGEGTYAGLGLDGMSFSRYRNDRLSASAGLSFPWERVGIDLGLGAGLSKKAPEWTATVGVSFQLSAPRPSGRRLPGRDSCR